MNPLSIPAKLASHYQRGGFWGVAYLITSRFPGLPLPGKVKWLLGRAHEIEFWDRYFQTKGLYWKSGFLERFDVERPLDRYVAGVLPLVEGGKLRVLDVGAGPLTSLSRGGTGREVEILAVDPLAQEYDRILGKYGFTPPIRTGFAEAENLLAKFPESTFDLVHARNSIDHSYNPMLAIRQMLAVTRPAGYVILQNKPNEATHENWVGLHQWNFSKEEDCFVIRNKTSATNVNRELAGAATVETELAENGGWLVVKMKKLASRSAGPAAGSAGRP